MTGVGTERSMSGMSQWMDGLLPTPHLLDASWWFDRRTVEAFSDAVKSLPQRAKVVFLGTPSLFLDAWQRAEGRDIWLVDRDEAIKKRLPQELQVKFQTRDLLCAAPCLLGADLVVADPPWYVEETMAFLAAGQAVARIGAEVQICLPPKGTRPTIEVERDDLFRWAIAGGLRLTQLLDGEVRYEAPPFEVNVFRSTQQPLEEQSRSGDLAIFAVDRVQGLVLPGKPVSDGWADHMTLGVRWRVREQAGIGEGSPELTTLGFSDNIFPSCSKRHAQRAKPDVWTSGNRAFCCQNPQSFLDILRSLHGLTLKEVAACAGRLYPSKRSREARAAAQIVTLLEAEQREIEALKQCPNGKET